MVDRGPSGFVYEVDSKIASKGLLWTLTNMKGGSSKAVLLVHEEASISTVNNVRGIMAKAGYVSPKIFYFGRDKDWMAELTFSAVVPFSAHGDVADKQ